MDKNIPVSNYPGWREAQSRGGFKTPDTLDVKALINLARKLAGGFNRFLNPTRPQASEQLVNPYVSSGNIRQVENTTQESPQISEQQVRQGFERFASNVPLATQSAVISQALQKLSPQIDPKLILALALKESRGGKDLVGREKGVNNPYNVMYQGNLINYPDLQTALMGGPNPLEGSSSRGLINILNSPLYQKYRQSGNLEDFFNVYSPPNLGNAPINTQVEQALKLMEYFK